MSKWKICQENVIQHTKEVSKFVRRTKQNGHQPDSNNVTGYTDSDETDENRRLERGMVQSKAAKARIVSRTHFISLMVLEDISCILFLAPLIVFCVSSMNTCVRGRARGA
jgi:hypothetical protein